MIVLTIMIVDYMTMYVSEWYIILFKELRMLEIDTTKFAKIRYVNAT